MLFTLERDLEFVMTEQIVFLAAAAFGALKTADEEYGNADRNQNGENASIHCEPMSQVLHFQSPLLQGVLMPKTNLPANPTPGNHLDASPAPMVTPSGLPGITPLRTKESPCQ